jgi:hypothetical protein
MWLNLIDLGLELVQLNYVENWRRDDHKLKSNENILMVLTNYAVSNTSLHVKEDFRKEKDGFCLGLNRRHQ